jgi:hypothetical protein
MNIHGISVKKKPPTLEILREKSGFTPKPTKRSYPPYLFWLAGSGTPP